MQEPLESSIKIRPANKTDFDQLVALFYEFFTVFNLEQTLSGDVKKLLTVDDNRAFAHDTIASYFEDNETLFVAVVDQDVIGYIAGHIKTDRHLLYSPEAEIVDWFVTQEYRNRGIGRELYATFVSEMSNRGCKALSLEAFYDNTQTIETYERLGFVRDSVILKKIL